MGSGENKSAKGAIAKQGEVAQKQLELSRKLEEEATPWRSIAGKYYTGIAEGGDELTKAVAPQINLATSQYQAQLRKIREMPAGGERDRAIRELRSSEAATKTGIYSGGVNEAINKIAQMGLTQTGMSLGGLSAAGSELAQIAQAYAQMSAGKGSSVGGLASAGGSITAAAIA